MLQMGDEMRRSQRGNNNAYCQDNQVSWLDWSLLERHRGLHRFVRTLIADRLRVAEAGGVDRFALSLNELLRHAEIDWHGVRLGSDNSHSIAATLRPGPFQLPFWLHVMFNAYWEALDFDLPPPAAAISGWQRWIDTSRESPEASWMFRAVRQYPARNTVWRLVRWPPCSCASTPYRSSESAAPGL
jgi:isoamylase